MHLFIANLVVLFYFLNYAYMLFSNIKIIFKNRKFLQWSNNKNYSHYFPNANCLWETYQVFYKAITYSSGHLCNVGSFQFYRWKIWKWEWVRNISNSFVFSCLCIVWSFTFPAVAKYSPSGDHSIKCTDTEVLKSKVKQLAFLKSRTPFIYIYKWSK